MTEFPFQLLIKRTSLGKQAETLTCRSLLRIIPGRRQVYDALWNNRDVVVKVFSHKISAKRHLKREWRGLNLLQKRGLNSPEPLFYGRTENRQWAVVMEKVADSSTILDVFNRMTNEAKKLDLLVLFCRGLAKQHSKGVVQKDLHLGNFLLQGDKVFALDPGQMRFFRRDVTRKKSISQLALLACCLPASDTESITRLCEEYFNARGWQFRESDELFVQKKLTVHRKKGIRKKLKKCLRTSKKHLRIKAGKHLAVFDRVFFQRAEPLDLIRQIDALMDAGQILKNGRTSYVSRLTWNGKDVVVKRYNHKGFIHSLRHTVKRSRARRSWLHGHRLGMLNIATPKPLAYIERCKGPLVWNSYLATEYVEGQNLYDFLRDGNVTEQQRSEVTSRIKEVLDKLGTYRISHDDLKHTNILITDNGPVLTDLDGMKVHRWELLYRNKRAKDMQRFLKKQVSHRN